MADDSAAQTLPAEGEALNKSLKDGRERGGCSYISIVTMRRHTKSEKF